MIFSVVAASFTTQKPWIKLPAAGSSMVDASTRGQYPPMNPVTDLLQHVRRIVSLPEGATPTDGQLLDAFIRLRDSQALEVLVRRHAAMVWGICRRRLAHHDAEDAFQATFLVLVRKAASIRSRDLLANWLFRVAHTTACKARQMAAKRSSR